MLHYQKKKENKMETNQDNSKTLVEKVVSTLLFPFEALGFVASLLPEDPSCPCDVKKNFYEFIRDYQ